VKYRVAQLHLSGLTDLPMKWGLKVTNYSPSLILMVDPKNEVIESFFHEVKTVRFPELLDSVFTSKRFGNEMSNYMHFMVMDWEAIENAKGITENEVEVWSREFGGFNINEKTFYNILYDYSLALLRIHRETGDVQNEYREYIEWRKKYFDDDYSKFNVIWSQAMTAGINKLQHILQ
jgi:hypothetical protein